MPRKGEQHAASSSTFCEWRFAALGAIVAARPLRAQTKPLTKVRYNEVVRSLLYAPYYVASTNGYFKDAGLDIEIATGNGGDKTMAALTVRRRRHRARPGPRPRSMCQQRFNDQGAHLLRPDRDRRLHAGRPHQAGQVRMEHVEGQGRARLPAGLTPLLFLEEAMRMNGVNPDTRRQARPTISPCPRGSALGLPARGEYAIFIEPDAVATRARRQRLIFSPPSAPRSALPTTRPSWRRTNIIADNASTVQSFTDAIYRAQKWTASASAGRYRQSGRADSFPASIRRR